jgi:hypothetical protein
MGVILIVYVTNKIQPPSSAVAAVNITTSIVNCHKSNEALWQDLRPSQTTMSMLEGCKGRQCCRRIFSKIK